MKELPDRCDKCGEKSDILHKLQMPWDVMWLCPACHDNEKRDRDAHLGAREKS